MAGRRLKRKAVRDAAAARAQRKTDLLEKKKARLALEQQKATATTAVASLAGATEGIPSGVLVDARLAKYFDVPVEDQKKSATKKRRGRPPKNPPPPPPPLPPARPETPLPTIKEIYYGTVTGYNHLDADYDHHADDVGLYHVCYDDGDTEVLDPDDIYNAFLLHNDEMLRMDIERSRAFPVLASKIAPSWREGTPTGQFGGRGLAHQRSLGEEELVVLDAERIGYWESYKTYNVSKGVARPVPYSPTGNRRSRASRTGASTNSRANREQREAAAATGGQTAGELSGSNEVVQPSAMTTRLATTRRAERVSARTAAAASLAESNRAVAKPSTPRRNKRKGPSEAAAAAPTSSATTNRGSGKRRKKAAGTAGSHGGTTQREERQAGDGDNTSETSVTVKEEAPSRNERRGWGLFRRTHTNGFGDICDLT